MEENRIKLAVVDDDEILTQLLANYLSENDNYEVVFTALDGSELIKKLKGLNEEKLPDIVLLDLRMKKMDGLETIPELKINYPGIKIIIITSHYKLSFIGFMVKNGINAFVPKSITPMDMVKVIDSVYYKDIHFSEDQVKAICSQMFNDNEKPIIKPVELSEREKEVLKLICYQHTAEEIGEKLHLAKRTIEGHRNRILSKTGVKNTAGLVVYAIRNKIVDIDEIGLDGVVKK